MTTIKLFEKYNLEIIQTEETATRIYNDLSAIIQNDTLQIDMDKILYITTNCMRRIIGQLYRDCGSERKFFEKVNTINVNKKISSVIDLVLEEERK